MVGKTGAARVALETGAPVIPIAQWGPQELLAPYAQEAAPASRARRCTSGPGRRSTCPTLTRPPGRRPHCCTR